MLRLMDASSELLSVCVCVCFAKGFVHLPACVSMPALATTPTSAANNVKPK